MQNMSAVLQSQKEIGDEGLVVEQSPAGHVALDNVTKVTAELGEEMKQLRDEEDMIRMYQLALLFEAREKDSENGLQQAAWGRELLQTPEPGEESAFCSTCRAVLDAFDAVGNSVTILETFEWIESRAAQGCHLCLLFLQSLSPEDLSLARDLVVENNRHPGTIPVRYIKYDHPQSRVTLSFRSPAPASFASIWVSSGLHLIGGN